MRLTLILTTATIFSIIQTLVIPINFTLIFVVGWLLFVGTKEFVKVGVLSAVVASIFADLPFGVTLLIYLLISVTLWAISNLLPARNYFKIVLLIVSIAAWEIVARTVLVKIGAL